MRKKLPSYLPTSGHANSQGSAQRQPPPRRDSPSIGGLWLITQVHIEGSCLQPELSATSYPSWLAGDGANGDHLHTTRVCKGLPITTTGDHEVFAVDCYAVPLSGYDVILDTQWLRTLEPILWDFDQLIHVLPSSRSGGDVAWGA